MGQGRVVVLMGVSGSGKTTLGTGLAAALGWAFADADDFHPRANVLKMAAGHRLDEADRAPWLIALRDWVRARVGDGERAVLACSLLRRAYREQVSGNDGAVQLVYLHAAPALLRARMMVRQGHFMPPSLLDSQLEAFEPPSADEGALRVEVGGSLADSLAAVVAAVKAAVLVLALWGAGVGVAAPLPQPARIATSVRVHGARATVVGLVRGDQWNALVAHIGSGDADWIALAPKLEAGLDAGTAASLTIVLRRALGVNALAVLAVLDTAADGVLGAGRICVGADGADRRARRAAVAGVAAPSLAAARAACLASLADERT